MFEDDYVTFSLTQSLLQGSLKEGLNHNKYLKLKARCFDSSGIYFSLEVKT